ncbi:MAG: Mur ligase family protein [Acidimicrobiales bacterium]
MSSLVVDAVVGIDGPVRFHSAVAWITFGACSLACGPAGLRWLRVAQREHYLGGAASVFARRWWTASKANLALAGAGVVSAVLSVSWPLVGVVTALVVAGGPLGLRTRGRTAPLVWTRRMKSLAAVWATGEALVLLAGVVLGLGAPAAVLVALTVPIFVDLACVVTGPVEHRLTERFVDEAAERLALVAPTVVGVTGSYGKTSTKGHIAHLVAPSRSVVATPASFNNRAGLARSINEHLTEGTEVFVAEMGTYGPGEIADLCRWCPPDISVITAIGPVHLERFGTEDRIVAAKSEILAPAGTVVLPVDDPRLSAVADGAAAEGKRVVRCSAAPDLDSGEQVDIWARPTAQGMTLMVRGATVVQGLMVPTGVQPSNLAVAVAVALELGTDPSVIAAGLRDLTAVDHRLQELVAPSGVVVFDDTYNSNPVGAAEALRALAGGGGGPVGGTAPGPGPLRVVVTPGMVELGRRQAEENRKFAVAVASVATDLVVVGRTNRKALLAGAHSVPGHWVNIHVVDDRAEAVSWVRDHLGPGDQVLYENDLPDHYP